MNKDHKRVLFEMKIRLESVSEDKNFLHQQLLDAKSINKSLMFELD